jgi:hypothetical protein
LCEIPEYLENPLQKRIKVLKMLCISDRIPIAIRAGFSMPSPARRKCA